MTNAVRCLCGGLLVLIGLTSVMLAAESPGLQIGVAETDITPPTGFLVAGYYHERQATGTLNPLKARALVFGQGSQRVAFVACDVIGIARDLSCEVRRRAAAQTGIPETHIVLAATHSHTAPEYTRDLYQYLGESAPERESRYAARLIGGIVEAIVQADAQRQPAAVDTGTVQQETPIAFNRRFIMRDGSAQTWMRLDNPAVVRSAGPIDPDVQLMLVRAAESDQPVSLLTNFALHLDTVGGTLWSADYPFYVEQMVQQTLGPRVISLFGNGCCGDINHVDPLASAVNKTDFIGQSLSGTVQQGLSQLIRIAQPTLWFGTAEVPLPLQEVTAEDIARSRTMLADLKAGRPVDTMMDQVVAYKIVMLDHLRNGTADAETENLINCGLSRTWVGVGAQLPAEVQVIALGQDLAIVCLPGEVFVELGLAIKQASPFRTTLVVELCNCVEMLYVPTRVAYALGSYEVTNTALQPGAGEALAEAAVCLLRQAAAAATAAAAPAP